MERMMHARKAQITVFMIIGIILLFSSALLFYIRSQITQQVAEEMIPVMEEVPLQAQPVKIYVEACVDQVTKAALKQLGRHGGYIDTENDALSGKAFMITPDPTQSDGVELVEGLFIPYWWYMSSQNTCKPGTCKLESLRPELSKTNDALYSVEAQIDAYIKQNLAVCIDEFRPFKNMGMQVAVTGEIKADTRVGDKDVSVIIEYPIEITNPDGQKTKITRYFVREDINLKKLFNMATEILNEEIKTAFLEMQALELIDSYSKPLSMSRLPPLAEFTVNPGEFMYWTRTETKTKIENNVLPIASGFLQVFMSRNYRKVIMFKKEGDEVLYDRIATSMMDRNILLLPHNYTGIEAKFMYSTWWPIYLNINNQEVLTATRTEIPLLSFIAGNSYRFYYDLSYPILVTLKDYDAFQGEGYEFNFAIEANLRNNRPANVSTGLTLLSQGSLVCNEDQRQGSNATIEVRDAYSFLPIEEARISMVFGNEGCNVGVTELNEDNKTTITTQLPSGLGQLRVQHNDYLEYSQNIFSAKKKQINMTVDLIPFKYINVSAYLRPLSYDQNGMRYVLPKSVGISPLGTKDTAMITFTRTDNDTFNDYKTYVGIKGNGLATAKLIPGTYEVTAYLILNETVNIPAEKAEYGGFMGMGGEPVELNATVLDQWIEGGVVLNNQTGRFKITKEALFGSERLVVYLLRFPLPMTHSKQFNNVPSLEQVGELEKYSNIYRTELQPQWMDDPNT